MSDTPPERDMPTERARLRDRHLIATVENRRTVGEELARTGEIPVLDRPDPSIPGSTPAGGITSPVTRTASVATNRVGRRRFWPRAAAVAAGATSLVAIYFVFTLWQVWSTGRSDQARPVDAIVVLGAAQYDGRPSPQLEGRLDHVVELWPQGLAPLVVVTGGNQPGDRFTEAEASADYLVEHGVPEPSILLEPSGTSTYESLEAVAALLEARSMSTVLIVTDPYHSLRSRMIAGELGLRAYVSPTDESVVTGGRELERQLGEAAGVAVGRLLGFDRLDGLTN